MSGAVRSVKKVFKGISSIFGGGPEIPSMSAAQFSRMSSTVGGPPSEAELAEQRAAMGASGLRPREEELRRQRTTGTRPLQGSGELSSFWS